MKSTYDQLPVRLLNPRPDSKVVYKGTKIATVEEIDNKPHGAILAVQPENKGVILEATNVGHDGRGMCKQLCSRPKGAAFPITSGVR